MARKYKGKTFYCKHCGGALTMRWVEDPRSGADWFPNLHVPFDCIDEIADYIGIHIPPEAI